MVNPAVRMRFLPIALYFGGSFLLHLLWENLHAPLYQGYGSFAQHFWMCFWAAATGDMLFMLIIFLALAFVHRTPYWLSDRRTFTHPATWVIALLLGFLIAVSFELWAVFVDDRWQYAAAMPVIPFLRVGLTPVLQMLLIPATVLFVSFRMARMK